MEIKNRRTRKRDVPVGRQQVLTAPTCNIMTKLLTFLIIAFSSSAFGQVKIEIPFDIKDYPTEKYTVRLDTFVFGKFKISMTQVDLRDLKTYKQNDFYWGVWINVILNGEISRLGQYNCKYSYGDRQNCRGMQIIQSPSENYFILFQKGRGSDGRLIFIDTTGIIGYRSNIAMARDFNSEFYLSEKSNLLFSVDADLSNGNCPYVINVQDLSKLREPPYIINNINNICESISDLYVRKKRYFGVVDNNESSKAEKITILNFDFSKKSFTKTTVDKAYFKKAKRLVSPCKCE